MINQSIDRRVIDAFNHSGSGWINQSINRLDSSHRSGQQNFLSVRFNGVLHATDCDFFRWMIQSGCRLTTFQGWMRGINDRQRCSVAGNWNYGRRLSNRVNVSTTTTVTTRRVGTLVLQQSRTRLIHTRLINKHKLTEKKDRKILRWSIVTEKNSIVRTYI